MQHCPQSFCFYQRGILPAGHGLLLLNVVWRRRRSRLPRLARSTLTVTSARRESRSPTSAPESRGYLTSSNKVETCTICGSHKGVSSGAVYHIQGDPRQKRHVREDLPRTFFTPPRGNSSGNECVCHFYLDYVIQGRLWDGCLSSGIGSCRYVGGIATRFRIWVHRSGTSSRRLPCFLSKSVYRLE